MRLSREQLKGLVKECLVELLSEGLGSGTVTSLSPTIPVAEALRKQVNSKKISPRFSPALDTPVSRQRTQSAALTEAIKIESGGNKLMADILADTAKTTLPNMLSAGDRSAQPAEGISATVNQQEKFNGTPEEVFGDDAAAKWAHLAFTPSPPAKNSTQS
jgi:hypothetical protein